MRYKRRLLARGRLARRLSFHQLAVRIEKQNRNVKLTREQMTRALADGDPPIQIGRVRGTGDKGVLISVFMLQDGEDRLVAERLRTILHKAAG